MAEVLSSGTPNLSWRRDLIGSKLVVWNILAARLTNITLNHERDDFEWNLDQAGYFYSKITLPRTNTSEYPKYKQKDMET